jgi:hypothetical protein
MHILTRSELAVPSATADYDVGDNGNFISFCDSFRYLGPQITPDLEESFDIDSRVRAAVRSFMSLKDIFFNKKIHMRTRKQLYVQTPMNLGQWKCDSWAMKATHIAKLTRFHHKCARS